MSRSLFARSLEPLAASLWGFFIAWTVLLGVMWIGCVDELRLHLLVENKGLQSALVAIVNTAVPVWLALAVVNIHLAFSRSEGLATARRWLLILLGAALAVGILNRLRSIPFGEVYFSNTLGPRLLGVPIGWPLLWVVQVAGARELFLWWRPRASHMTTALAGAVLVSASFANLEPLAHDIRWKWWLWYQGKLTVAAPPPWSALVVVLVLSGVLGWLLRETRLTARQAPRSRKPAIIFLVLNVLLLLAHLRLWLAPPAPLPLDFGEFFQ